MKEWELTEDGLLEEGKLYKLNVRERRNELELDSHIPNEGDVLEKDGHRCRDESVEERILKVSETREREERSEDASKDKAHPFPILISRTIFGLVWNFWSRGVTSDRSVGVKLIFQSMRTTSSGVLGKVRTESIRGAEGYEGRVQRRDDPLEWECERSPLLPRVKVVILIDSRKLGVLVERTWSTEATIVAERTGS